MVNNIEFFDHAINPISKEGKDYAIKTQLDIVCLEMYLMR